MDGVRIAGVGRLRGAAQKLDPLTDCRGELTGPLALEQGLFLNEKMRKFLIFGEAFTVVLQRPYRYPVPLNCFPVTENCRLGQNLRCALVIECSGHRIPPTKKAPSGALVY